MWDGRIKFAAPMLFAVGAISFFSKCKSIHDYFHFQYTVYVVDIFQPLSLT
jgi:heme/copper-type cytochrome/quinol oxidase subunit 1